MALPNVGAIVELVATDNSTSRFAFLQLVGGVATPRLLDPGGVFSSPITWYQAFSGPLSYGGALYAIGQQYDPISFVARPVVKQSVDGGATWAELDAANSPTNVSGADVACSWQLNPSGVPVLILTFILPGASFTSHVTEFVDFSLATGRYGVPYGGSTSPQHGGVGDATNQQLARRSDGSLVWLAHDTAGSNKYIVYNGAWGSFILPYPGPPFFPFPPFDKYNIGQCGPMFVGTDDRIHVMSNSVPMEQPPFLNNSTGSIITYGIIQTDNSSAGYGTIPNPGDGIRTRFGSNIWVDDAIGRVWISAFTYTYNGPTDPNGPNVDVEVWYADYPLVADGTTFTKEIVDAANAFSDCLAIQGATIGGIPTVLWIANAYDGMGNRVGNGLNNLWISQRIGGVWTPKQLFINTESFGSLGIVTQMRSLSIGPVSAVARKNNYVTTAKESLGNIGKYVA